MNLLEEEVSFDESVLVSLAHALQWVELSLKVSFESVTCLYNFVHDLKSLLLGNTWAKRIIGKISSNSDSSGVDEGGLLLGEISVLKSIRSHIRDVLGVFVMLVIVENDLVEKLLELSVSIVRSSIDTNARILVCNSRENAHLERNACCAFLILVLFPNFLGKALLALRFGVSSEEVVEVDKIFG